MKLPIQHERLNRTLERVFLRLEDLLLILRKYLLTGILVLVPMAVTIYIMYFLFQLTDGFLGVAVSRAIGYRIPGMGLFLTMMFFIIAGVIAQNYVGRRILSGIEGSLEAIPVVRSLYNGIKQVADVVVQKNRGEFKRVVMVEYPKEHSWTLGFVTNDFLVPIQSDLIDCHKMATVFVPTTPNPTSGFLLIIEKDRILDTNMDIEDAMKIVISGGLVQPGRISEKVEEAKIDDSTIPH